MNEELFKRILSSIFLIPFVLILIISGSLFFNFFLLIVFLITMYEWHKLSKKKIYYFPGFIFLILSFLSVYFLRQDSNNESLYAFIYIMFVSVFTDFGGYIFGKFLKGPKLTKISPNKTFTGMFGGYILALIFTYIYIDKTNTFFKSYEIISIDIFILTILLSTVSQTGDLLISYFKRKAKIKDTGNLIPGHGGVLDRIDGMIFVFPFFYILKLLF